MAGEATIATPVVSGTTPLPTNADKSKTSAATLASNFQTFLTLLTTQLQNQNPLDPLDTNQFTQQLVQFAQVEQQLKQNDQLTTLVTLQKTAQASQALNFVGSTALVDGKTTTLGTNGAGWSLNSPKPASAQIFIKSAAGVTAFSGSYSLKSGDQTFTWDGKGNDGTKWPEGSYTIEVVAKDAAGQNVAIGTQIAGVVDSADLSQTPPLLSIGGQTFTTDQIKKVIARASGS
ncbi:MAG: flagellar biosynthesis protein FlgD [Proteobacteria bacterium SG_bin9]|nr:MAG: flagellar biosynthesis protein FlgD [Proteobacteria bacterium SG_bin9]